MGVGVDFNAIVFDGAGVEVGVAVRDRVDVGLALDVIDAVLATALDDGDAVAVALPVGVGVDVPVAVAVAVAVAVSVGVGVAVGVARTQSIGSCTQISVAVCPARASIISPMRTNLLFAGS